MPHWKWSLLTAGASCFHAWLSLSSMVPSKGMRLRGLLAVNSLTEPLPALQGHNRLAAAGSGIALTLLQFYILTSFQIQAAFGALELHPPCPQDASKISDLQTNIQMAEGSQEPCPAPCCSQPPCMYPDTKGVKSPDSLSMPQ